MKISIWKYNPSVDAAPYLVSGEVPYKDMMTVLEVLIYFNENIEFVAHDYNCHGRQCGRCSLMMDGVPVLACATKVEGGKRPFVVRHMIQNACDHCCGLIRKKEDLEEALAELKRIRKEELPLMVLADDTKSFNTEWKEAIENYNLLDAAELMVQASLLREESTHGTFFRPDFPEIGGEEWNCMLVGRWSEDGPVFEKKQYPLFGE